jgi:hypothetical protein
MTNPNMTLYTAIIPKQEEGTTVQFKITAEDVLGFIAESSIMSYVPASLYRVHPQVRPAGHFLYFLLWLS